MPTQKIVLPASPKFEPFYVSLQVAAQSDATYLPGYSCQFNKRIPNAQNPKFFENTLKNV